MADDKGNQATDTPQVWRPAPRAGRSDQEQRSGGQQSNFFRLENPGREDA